MRDIEPSDLEGADAIVHLAALSNDVLGDLDPERTFEINHQASVRIAEMAKQLGTSRFIFASSCSMYGASSGEAPLDESAEFSPVTAYAKSKVLVERDVSQMADDSFSPTFMRNATLMSALAGFLPLIWLSLVFGWGLVGIWSGLSTFMVLRLLFVGWRAFSGRWLIPGTA